MSRIAHRLLLCLSVLAFLAGVPLALSVPLAFAGEPCPHEHHGMSMDMPHEHQHPAPQHKHADACTCCCMGACAAVPDLARGQGDVVLFSASEVSYWERGVAFTGRTLRPEPAPPRSIA